MGNIRNKIYILLFFLTAFCWLLPFYARYICIVLLVLFHSLSNVFLNDVKLNRLFFLFFVIILSLLAHLAVTNIYELIRFSYVPFNDLYLGYGIMDFFRLLATATWVYVVAYLLQKHEQSGVLFFALSTGFNLFAAVLLFNLPSFNLSNGTRLALSFQESGFEVHPNQIAYAIMLFFYVNLVASYYVDKFILKLYYYVFCILSFFLIIMTMSRTSLLSLLLGCALLFFKKMRISLFLFLILWISYLGLFDVGVLSILPARFTVNQAIEDKASGRTAVWSDYFTYATLKDYLVGTGYSSDTNSILYQKPLLMEGIQSSSRTPNSLAKYLGTLSTHNTYLQALFTFGVIAFCIYFCFLLYLGQKIIKNAISKGRVYWVYLSMYISFLLCGFFEGVATPSFLFVAIFISQSINFNDTLILHGSIENEKRIHGA